MTQPDVLRKDVPPKRKGALLRRPQGWVRFFLTVLAWMLVLTLAWSKVSPWTSWPVGALSGLALEQGAPMWVRSVHHLPGKMEVVTSIEKAVPGAPGRRAELLVEADPARYAYGLPIFLALLLAARGPALAARAMVGYLLLLPAQAFSLTMLVLMQMVVYAQASTRLLKVSQWQVEAIVYGYQVGSLVVPTLVPIMVWLWLDRQFFCDVVVGGWRPMGGHAVTNDAHFTPPSGSAHTTPAQQAALAEAEVKAEVRAAEKSPSMSRASAIQPASKRPKNPSISTSADAGLPERE